MESHLLLLTLFALFVSAAFAVLTKNGAREQAKFGGALFAGFVLTALVLGWLMYPFPR